jgi:hypothetical protein
MQSTRVSRRAVRPHALTATANVPDDDSPFPSVRWPAEPTHTAGTFESEPPVHRKQTDNEPRNLSQGVRSDRHTRSAGDSARPNQPVQPAAARRSVRNSETAAHHTITRTRRAGNDPATWSPDTAVTTHLEKKKATCTSRTATDSSHLTHHGVDWQAGAAPARLKIMTRFGEAARTALPHLPHLFSTARTDYSATGCVA